MYTEPKRPRLMPSESTRNEVDGIQDTILEDEKISSGTSDKVNDDDQNEGNEIMYESLTLEQVHARMKACIDSVDEILPFPVQYIRILLRQFGWDKESLKEAYFDSNDDRKFLEHHGIFNTLVVGTKANHHGADALNTEEEPQTENSTSDCEICYDSFSLTELYSLSCHHNFCSQCWRTYLISQIMNEGLSDTITCPGHDCKVILDDHTISRFIEEDENVYLKYKYLLASSFVQCNPLMCWCSSPSCTNVITAQWKDIRTVMCSCGFQFCFSCQRQAHDPIECQILEKWMKKQQEFTQDDDPASADWINNNTKPCPKCKTPIEKDGGCNHVKCSKCLYEFCFLCLGPSHGHVWSCSKPEEIFSGSPTDTTRLKYFSTHFLNHFQSLTLERELLKKVDNKMNELHQNETISWIETQFLQQAIKTLCACRQTVMYSYVFRYYAKDHAQLYIFDKNHEDLGRATETLSFLLGFVMGLSSEHIMKKKQQIFDQNLYCESRRNVLVSHASDGYVKKWWEMRSECL